jgi:RNA polymerase sigma-70 factor (ECF subfamily)
MLQGIESSMPAAMTTLTALLPPLPRAVAWHELVAHRSYLVRFARHRLHDAALAEDAVHDVFEAVLSGRASFGGRAALRSWLTAVLKHKIVDVLRRQKSHEPIEADDATAEGAALPSPDPGPDEIAEHREQLARTLARIEALPCNLREVLERRVFDEQPTDVVCTALGISEDNLFVRLHRARRQLAA